MHMEILKSHRRHVSNALLPDRGRHSDARSGRFCKDFHKAEDGTSECSHWKRPNRKADVPQTTAADGIGDLNSDFRHLGRTVVVSVAIRVAPV